MQDILICIFSCYSFFLLFSFLTSFFPLQMTFNIILYQFQVYSIVVRHLFNLGGDLPNNSSTQLAPHIVITILLTIFPVLYLISLGLLCNYQFALLNFLIFFIQSTNLLPSGNHQFDLCIHESVSVSSAYFVLQIPHVSEITWYSSLSV